MADEKVAVPYIAFRTILNLADKIPDVPPRIDRSVLSYLSGGYQSQTLIALKALALIDEQGTPSEEMVTLLSTPARRKEMVASIWKRAYAPVYAAIDVERATNGQLDEAFKASFGVEGETRRKAITFFLHGAQFAELPLSQHFTATKRSPTTTRRKPKGGAKSEANGLATPEGTPTPPADTNRQQGHLAPVHEMLTGAILWLHQNGERWTEAQSELWCQNFINSVKLVYPPHTRAERPARSNVGQSQSAVGDTAQARPVSLET